MPITRLFFLLLSFGLSAIWFDADTCLAEDRDSRPNILFAIADDWGWPHAGAYDDPVVQTPTFDRLAKEGMLFRQAFVSSPSCTPSRGAILTGRYHWQLGVAANLYGSFPDSQTTYVQLLENAGYQTGKTGKCWGPGVPETKSRMLGGKAYKSFEQFYSERDPSKPFCFWLGSSDPHRPYNLDSGKEDGMDLAKIQLPAYFPDNKIIRGDVADYYFAVQRFDKLIGRAVALLESSGQLDNTLIAMTGDHGMPFPRCKSHVYDSGSRVPLAIRFPKSIQRAQSTDALVSLIDLAPTFLEIAGITIPSSISGRSLQPIFQGKASDRTSVCFGKERHVPSQEFPDSGGYPCRGIRTNNFLYIRNYEPNRWPSGTPNYDQAYIKGSWYSDSDNGPTKTYMIQHKDDSQANRLLYDLAFGKRPAQELYDLSTDPDQMINVADSPKYILQKQKLIAELERVQDTTDDPRSKGQGDLFDNAPYSGGSPKHPSFDRSKSPK